MRMSTTQYRKNGPEAIVEIALNWYRRILELERDGASSKEIGVAVRQYNNARAALCYRTPTYEAAEKRLFAEIDELISTSPATPDFLR